MQRAGLYIQTLQKRWDEDFYFAVRIVQPDSADICLVPGSRANVCCQEWSRKLPDPRSCLPKSRTHGMNWNASESWRKETLGTVLRQVMTGAPGTPELGRIRLS